VRGAFADDVCYIALAPIRDPGLVATAVAQALGRPVRRPVPYGTKYACVCSATAYPGSTNPSAAPAFLALRLLCAVPRAARFGPLRLFPSTSPITMLMTARGPYAILA